MNKKNNTYLSYSITTVIFLFFINYLRTEPNFLEILSSTKLTYLALIIFLSFIRMVILSYLNIYLYKLININMRFKESFKVVFFNRAGNQIMPLKLGSGYKLHYFVNKLKAPLSTYLSINTGQSLINLLFNSVILLIAVNAYSSFYEREVLKLINLFIGIFILMFVAVIIITFYIDRSRNISDQSILYRVNLGMKSLFVFNKNQILFLLSTLLLTVVNIIIAFVIADMYVLNNSISEAIKLYAVGQFSGLVSITPGNIGVSELILISLQDLYIYKTSEILAISLVGRITDYLLIIFLNFFIKKTD